MASLENKINRKTCVDFESFILKYRWNGEWKEVLIDDRLPTVNNKLVFTQLLGNQFEFWPSLLEKVFRNCLFQLNLIILINIYFGKSVLGYS
jgi:hypothetical protein